MGIFWNHPFGQKHENKNLKQKNKYLELFYPKQILHNLHNKHPNNNDHIVFNSALYNSCQIQKVKNQTEVYKTIKSNTFICIDISKNKPSDKKLIHISGGDTKADDENDAINYQASDFEYSQDVESSGQDSPSAPDFVDA